MHEPLRAGVVGVGFIGAQHIDALHRIPQAQVVALTETSPQAADMAGKRCGVQSVYTDWREMIDREQLDVLHNCTPNGLHDDINRYAMEAGLHVYSEKPLSTSAQAAQALAEFARARGVAAGVNQNYRFNVMVHQMRAVVQRGDLGAPIMARGAYLQDWLMYETDMNWRMETENGRLRALGDIGVHILDLMQWVLGRRIARVMTDTTIVYPERGPMQARAAIATEDCASTLLRFEDGLPGAFTVSQVSGGHKNDLWLAIDCAQGSIEWRQEEADRLYVGRRGQGNEMIFAAPESVDAAFAPLATLPIGHAMAWADAVRNAMSVFYTSILDGSYQSDEPPFCTFEEGAQAMAVLEAMMRSDQTGTWTDVE